VDRTALEQGGHAPRKRDWQRPLRQRHWRSEYQPKWGKHADQQVLGDVTPKIMMRQVADRR
jgi:hypothetical protein